MVFVHMDLRSQQHTHMTAYRCTVTELLHYKDYVGLP